MEHGFKLTVISAAELPTADEQWAAMRADAELYVADHSPVRDNGIPERPALIVEYVYRNGGRLGLNDFLKGFVRAAAESAGLSSSDAADLVKAAHWNLDDRGIQYFYDKHVDRYRS